MVSGVKSVSDVLDGPSVIPKMRLTTSVVGLRAMLNQTQSAPDQMASLDWTS
jgi:hypothetical protein